MLEYKIAGIINPLDSLVSHLRDEVARFKRRYPHPTNDQIRTYIQDTSVFFDMLRDDPKFFKKAVGLFYEAVVR